MDVALAQIPLFFAVQMACLMVVFGAILFLEDQFGCLCEVVFALFSCPTSHELFHAYLRAELRACLEIDDNEELRECVFGGGNGNSRSARADLPFADLLL